MKLKFRVLKPQDQSSKPIQYLFSVYDGDKETYEGRYSRTFGQKTGFTLGRELTKIALDIIYARDISEEIKRKDNEDEEKRAREREEEKIEREEEKNKMNRMIERLQSLIEKMEKKEGEEYDAGNEGKGEKEKKNKD